MSIEQLGPRRFSVRVQFRDPRTGKKRTFRATVEGTEKAAERKEQELRAAAQSAGDRKPRRPLADYASSWLKHRLSTLKPSVATRYASALDLHILPALGDRYVDSLMPSDVQEYVAARLDEVVRDIKDDEGKVVGHEKTSGYTVLNELRVLRTIAKDSVAEGLAERDWCARVKAPAVGSYTDEEPNLLSATQLGTLLGAIPAYWRPLVALLSFTGLRWGEASALRWEDIDDKRFEIRVRRANWRGQEVEVKTAKSRRTVPLPPVAAAFLGEPGKGLMFPTKKGKLHRGTPLRTVLNAACIEVGISTRLTTHGLRRTYNDLCRRVASREVVKSITGHATDSMLEHYSRVDHDEKALATKKVLELIGVIDAEATEP